MQNFSNRQLALIARRLADEEGHTYEGCLRPVSGEVHLIRNGDTKRVLRIGLTGSEGYIHREAAALMVLADSPGIDAPKLKTVSSFTAGGWPGTYLIKDFKEGEVVQKGQRFTEDQFDDLADIIDRIHRKGVSQLDMREDNLLVVDGRLKLFEFTDAAMRNSTILPDGTYHPGSWKLYNMGKKWDVAQYFAIKERLTK